MTYAALSDAAERIRAKNIREWEVARRVVAGHRAAIDAVLAEDARRCPPFALARRCAVLASEETRGVYHRHDAATLLEICHRYEGWRGGARAPSRLAQHFLDTWRETSAFAALEVYERSRSA